jgi:hypothetical protein
VAHDAINALSRASPDTAATPYHLINPYQSATEDRDRISDGSSRLTIFARIWLVGLPDSPPIATGIALTTSLRVFALLPEE